MVSVKSPLRKYKLDIVKDRFVLWSSSEGEAAFVLSALSDLGYLTMSHVSEDLFQCQVTPKGWMRAEELSQGQAYMSDTSTAFVAMSFADELKYAFKHGISPAIEATGHEPMHLGMLEHNELIDDQIVARIREARFLVADLTQHRAGVYYEAGFAHGLGKPVIFLVREDHQDEVHFDASHYNHIIWTDESDLRSKLTNRILATIGRAPKGREVP